MRIILLIGLLMAAGTIAASTTLYRWVDEQGRLHYSDQPQPQAEEIQVGEPSSFRVDPPAPTQLRKRKSSKDEASTTSDKYVGYESVSITAPTQDQVLWNLGTVLNVALSVRPELQPGHQIKVLYNGREVKNWPAGATRFQIKDVYRGTHTVSVSIFDSAGNSVATGDTVTFHVKQTSVLN